MKRLFNPSPFEMLAGGMLVALEVMALIILLSKFEFGILWFPRSLLVLSIFCCVLPSIFKKNFPFYYAILVVLIIIFYILCYKYKVLCLFVSPVFLVLSLFPATRTFM